MANFMVNIENLRSLAAGSITSSYVQVGTSLVNACRIIRFVNATNGDVLVTDDGINDKIYMPANSFVLLDCNTNRLSNQSYWVMPSGTPFYIKRGPLATPSTGSFYIEAYWGQLA